ncbi:MAG: hypothetical protein C0506_13620 [Anaerolinea sp.]|nr:hypothetical protein [Anaerolinea sp.]
MTTVRKHPLREQFEAERRRAAFLSFLAGSGIGIIAADTWVSHWLGIPGGLAIGGFAYGVVYAYETLMWRKHHG